MKEVLFRIFEANPKKQDYYLELLKDRHEFRLSIERVSNNDVIHFINLNDFESLKETEQQSLVNVINSILDWYNLQH